MATLERIPTQKERYEQGEKKLGYAGLCKQRPTRLPAQGHDHDQQKPRDGVYRGLAGSEHVQVGGRHNRAMQCMNASDLVGTAPEQKRRRIN